MVSYIVDSEADLTPLLFIVVLNYQTHEFCGNNQVPNLQEFKTTKHILNTAFIIRPTSCNVNYIKIIKQSLITVSNVRIHCLADWESNDLKTFGRDSSI